MKTIPACPVQHGSIHNVVYGLIDNAPACTTFNGVTLRARYKTTRHSDIVAQYNRKMKEREYLWRAKNPVQAAEWDARAITKSDRVMVSSGSVLYGKTAAMRRVTDQLHAMGYSVGQMSPVNLDLKQ